MGWYLEPYALAAALTVQQRQIPLFVKTAGSDIGKLATHPDLRHAYSIAFERADCVFVGRSETARATMEGLGSRPNRMVSLRTSTLPRSFTRTAEPVPLDWRAQLSAAAATTAGAERALVSHYLQQNDGGALDPKAPTIGVYGKVGETKGTYDLLAALSGLALEGVKFNLLWMPAGTPERLKPFFRCINELRAQHGWIQVLPPLPPWKVPGFLARCDLTCVLERRFPVEFHGPRLPREVLASGSALVISREVAAKQSFASNLVHLKNCVLIENPSDTEELKSALGQVLSDASLRTYIRRHGQYLSKTVEPFLEAGHSVLNAIEDLMSELTDRDAGAMLPVDRRR